MTPTSIGRDAEAVDVFYRDHLRDLLGRGDRRRVEGKFGEPKGRTLRFFDTSGLLLDKAGFCLRQRTQDDENSITLKLRLPDFFIVAGASFVGKDQDAETKLEEDISPLEVATQGGGLAIDKPQSMRSRFSLSVSQPAADDHKTIATLLKHFPGLKDDFKDADLDLDPSTGLVSGPKVRELVFSGPEVDFGFGIVAEVSLSLWDLSPPAPVNTVAEISFSYKTMDGRVPGGAAREALDLFVDMQRLLRIDVSHASKTKLALPTF